MPSDSESEEDKGAANEKPEEEVQSTTFEALGVCEELCEACVGLKWTKPTEIQASSIPHLVKGTPSYCARLWFVLYVVFLSHPMRSN